MRVALDARGGSLAPEAIVASALQALRADKDLRITWVGDERRLLACLAGLNKLRDRVQTHPASQVIAASEDPIQALRAKPDTSIGRCWQLLAEKKVEVLVTMSPAPAVVAAGMRLRRFLPHVRRPGLAALLPTPKGTAVLIDAGAHADARPAHLYQFGIMGMLFCRRVLRIDKPRLGLLSASAMNGNALLLREGQQLFEASCLQPRFVGRVDAQAVFQGIVDVAVCDGGTGSLTLGTCESLSAFLADLPAARPSRPFAAVPRPLLGIDGIGLVVPEQAGARGVGDALALAARIQEVEFNQQLSHDLETGPLVGAAHED